MAVDVDRENWVRVATALPMDFRIRLMERTYIDRTTLSQVIRVCLQAYLDGAVPEEYMKQIREYRLRIAPVNRGRLRRKAD